MKTYTDRKGIWGWIVFDWANQPFHTLIITFIFGPYFLAMVIGDDVLGQTIWGYMSGVAGIIVAATAPFLGAIADRNGARKPWVFAFGVMFVIGCWGLWWAVPGAQNLWGVYIAFGLAFMGAEYMLIFANAMLPDLAPREEVGKLSGYGWGFGYLGGVVILALMLLFLSPPPGESVTVIGMDPLFGLDPAKGEPARASGPISAVWFIIFALPLFLWTPDVKKRAPLSQSVGEGIQDVRKIWTKLKNFPQIGVFYLSSMLYRDGLVVLYTFGSIYAAGVLGWSSFELGVFGIIAAITGAFGAYFGGLADAKWGPTLVVSISIFFLLSVSIIVLATTRETFFGMALAEGSSAPDIIFFVCGAIIGAAGGSMQASSRTLVVYLTEDKLPTTEAFGIYALAGKATAFIGPFTVGLATQLTGSQRLGVSPVIILFAASLILLLMVSRMREQR